MSNTNKIFSGIAPQMPGVPLHTNSGVGHAPMHQGMASYGYVAAQTGPMYSGMTMPSNSAPNMMYNSMSTGPDHTMPQPAVGTGYASPGFVGMPNSPNVVSGPTALTASSASSKSSATPGPKAYAPAPGPAASASIRDVKDASSMVEGASGATNGGKSDA